MKRLKRILLIIALLLTVLALFLSGGVVLVHGTPEYYKPIVLTREQIDAASQSAEQTLARMQSIAAENHSAQIRSASAQTQPTTSLSDEYTFAFSQDELNALFLKWAALHGWRDELDRIVTDPMIILTHGRVILAGHAKVKNLQTILSLHFEPRVDDQGRFDLNLVSVMAGKLPLPRELVLGPVRQRLQSGIGWRLARWQERAHIEPSGIANHDAMYASLAKLLIHEVNDEPTPAVLFLPNGQGLVPVRLARVSVASGSISFAVAPVDPHERQEVLDELRRPLHDASPDR
jgi:hypothetical protein